MRTKKALVMGLAVCVAMVSVVYAAVIIDDEGIGFVGKGDVQLVYDWNNKDLQDNAEDVQFRMNSEVVTEVSWICTNSNNDNIQERERTTTTASYGLLESVARLKNQTTGFNLNGWDEDTFESSSFTDGPAINSCPSGPWSLTTPAGDPEVVSLIGGLQVSIDGIDWYDLE
jgi:hypothetical protein